MQGTWTLHILSHLQNVNPSPIRVRLARLVYDEQSDRCWVDVPTQAAPDLRPTRTLQLVAQLAHHQPLHLLHC